MSIAHLGKKHTEATKRKISIALTGRPVTSATRKKIGIASSRRKHTDASKKKMSKTRLGLCCWGEESNVAKLTDADVFIIKNELKKGTSGAALGRRFNVTRSTISRIKKGKTWKHI